MLSVQLTHLVHGHDARMLETGDGGRLLAEPPDPPVHKEFREFRET
jgi:hypothetical protein